MPHDPLNERAAVVTVAMGRAAENLDYTFHSFARHNPGLPLHVFILDHKLPERRLAGIQYHLAEPTGEFSHPLRELYFRRHALIDRLDLEHALVVDCFDVLCLQPLPDLARLLGDADVGACVEHMGSRYVMGQGYTANFLNGGVFLWNLPRSRDIRQEVVERGKSHFRTVADDQHCLNEVLQTKFYHRLRILPCQYNYRAYFRKRQRGWPTVDHLDGVVLYHNLACMDAARSLDRVKARAALPELPRDPQPLTPRQQFWRRLRLRFQPWIVK